ncbi:Uncharacterized protein FWK35_00013390, partial [Aphis craccivora]
KNRFGRKLVLHKNSRFSLIFFRFFTVHLKSIGKFKNGLPNAPTRFTLPSETTPKV